MRVIAGKFRGRRLVAPDGSGTRPTADRVREALFSTLGSVEGLRVLDLYAGTGALGIESLSRGAAAAVFVECARPALQCLDQNVSALGLAQVVALLRCRVERAREPLTRLAPFDVIFCDPPWPHLAEAWATLNKLEVFNWTTPEGLLVLEYPSKLSLPAFPTRGFQVVCEKKWGDTGVTILQRGQPCDEPEHPTANPEDT